jgi:hypothetical protein
MLSYLSKTTLDVIGLAGFNYEFNSLKNKSSELSTAFESILQSSGGFPLFQFLKEQIPILRFILRFDTLSRNLDHSQKTMRAIGQKLIAQKKQEIEAEREAGTEAIKGGSKDLLTLLLKSNMSEKAERLTDDEVLHQIPTFLLAGKYHSSSRIELILKSRTKVTKQHRPQLLGDFSLLQPISQFRIVSDKNSGPSKLILQRWNNSTHCHILTPLSVKFFDMTQLSMVPLEWPFRMMSFHWKHLLPTVPGK